MARKYAEAIPSDLDALRKAMHRERDKARHWKEAAEEARAELKHLRDNPEVLPSIVPLEEAERMQALIQSLQQENRELRRWGRFWQERETTPLPGEGGTYVRAVRSAAGAA